MLNRESEMAKKCLQRIIIMAHIMFNIIIIIIISIIIKIMTTYLGLTNTNLTNSQARKIVASTKRIMLTRILITKQITKVTLPQTQNKIW